MKKNDYTLLWAAVVAAAVVAAINFLFVDSGSTDEPAHVRLKNLLHGAHYADDEATEVARRLYYTNNRASATLPLRQGCCGWQVELVQRLLNRYGRAHLVEDGVWGRLTERAIARHYTNATGYQPALLNRYFSYIGVNYEMSTWQFTTMMNEYGTALL